MIKKGVQGFESSEFIKIIFGFDISNVLKGSGNNTTSKKFLSNNDLSKYILLFV